MSSLPPPSPEALAHSACLAEAIRHEIAQAGGWLSFARYMELALYAPGLGYYSAGAEKLGEGGDFVTAPEISTLFGRCVARQAAQVLAAVGGSVLELGAGSGKLAVDVLNELDRLGQLPERYCILEVSGDLRARQQRLIQANLSPALAERVSWLDVLPEAFTGVVLGNEVLDAVPVHLVAWKGEGLYERGVGFEDGRFVWRDRALTQGPLLEAASQLDVLPEHLSEISLAASGLVMSLARMLEKGAVILVDYGFPRREFYHPHRAQGTLMCHYRHQSHDDPLIYPGLQDITAHVDFTAAAEAAVDGGASLMGYCSQTQFLINCGITSLLSEVSPNDAAAYLPLAAQAQKLLSPAEMGELFKAIAFGKGLQPLLGFAGGDKRHTL
jgi:SAM-dependent MidA family methyltransferase